MARRQPKGEETQAGCTGTRSWIGSARAKPGSRQSSNNARTGVEQRVKRNPASAKHRRTGLQFSLRGQMSGIMPSLKIVIPLFALFFIVPLGLAALRYHQAGVGADWWSADRSSIGHLPAAGAHPAAVVRVFAAPTVRWRGIFAVHCWIVVKPEGAASYSRYDYTAWGEPLRVNGFAPDGRWFGRLPELVFAADGAAAAAMIPGMQAAIETFRLRGRGDYRAWPGPNSNTFVAAVLDAVPGAAVVLPPNAIGKDYPYDGHWLRRTASGTGVRLSLGGYAGLTLGWVEGVELNILGGVVGLDIRRPAIKLPGLGRLGLPSMPAPA